MRSPAHCPPPSYHPPRHAPRAAVAEGDAGSAVEHALGAAVLRRLLDRAGGHAALQPHEQRRSSERRRARERDERRSLQKSGGYRYAHRVADHHGNDVPQGIASSDAAAPPYSDLLYSQQQSSPV